MTKIVADEFNTCNICKADLLSMGAGHEHLKGRHIWHRNIDDADSSRYDNLLSSLLYKTYIPVRRILESITKIWFKLFFNKFKSVVLSYYLTNVFFLKSQLCSPKKTVVSFVDVFIADTFPVLLLTEKMDTWFFYLFLVSALGLFLFHRTKVNLNLNKKNYISTLPVLGFKWTKTWFVFVSIVPSYAAKFIKRHFLMKYRSLLSLFSVITCRLQPQAKFKGCWLNKTNWDFVWFIIRLVD